MPWTNESGQILEIRRKRECRQRMTPYARPKIRKQQLPLTSPQLSAHDACQSRVYPTWFVVVEKFMATASIWIDFADLHAQRGLHKTDC